MLYRKIESKIRSYLSSDSNKMMIVEGARQIGKSFIIRHVGQIMFENYVEINMESDKQGPQLFKNVRTAKDFLLVLSTIAGDKLKDKATTLVFIDEIQVYSQLLTLVKFLMEDGRYRYIASGSQLGITLRQTQSLPIGSMELVSMYPLDLEEFAIANSVGDEALRFMRESFDKAEGLPDGLHTRMMDLLRRYLLVGGMPDAVNTYLSDHNVVTVRKVQNDIRLLYKQDAAKYETDSRKKLKIQQIYDMIPSNLENKKKRVVAKDIEGKAGKRMSDYQDEFEYLISSGIALEVRAVSKPSYPLLENSGKNLLKLYLNDVGLLTATIYRNNIKPILDDECSINLGSVYESYVAQELRAHGFTLNYYDNKKNGEVDYIVDDADNLSIMPIEVKSGKDYKRHIAIDRLIATKEYGIKKAIVLSNEQRVSVENGILYMPVYYSMFILPSKMDAAEFIEI